MQLNVAEEIIELINKNQIMFKEIHDIVSKENVNQIN